MIHSDTGGIILCMRPANERWSYNVTSSPIGWAHIQNDPWYYDHNGLSIMEVWAEAGQWLGNTIWAS